MTNMILYIFCFLAAISAAGILFIKDVFKSALMLLSCLLSLAGVYVLLFAEFIAVTQILIYAGGIVILIIFGIMLTSRITGQTLKVDNANIFQTIIAAAGLMGLLIIVFRNTFNDIAVTANLQSQDSIRTTGLELMTSYVLPFELAGILLLVALVGAAVIATGGQRKV